MVELDNSEVASSFQYISGRVPLIISMPHTGTYVPAGILDRFTDKAKQLPDTDWHIDRLYDFAQLMGCHMLVPACSRYVIDLNRPEDDTSLYPGKFTTGLVPVTLFNGQPLYLSGKEPDAVEIQQRIVEYWQPYHDKLQSIVDELKKTHKKVVVFDAHSIRSEVSTLFDGVLPDLNIGTADGQTCDSALAEAVMICVRQSKYSAVINGRFKGGYITRHYGRPEQGVHTVQLELAQNNYMQEDYPFAYNEIKAARLQEVLKQIMTQLIHFVAA